MNAFLAACFRRRRVTRCCCSGRPHHGSCPWSMRYAPIGYREFGERVRNLPDGEVITAIFVPPAGWLLRGGCRIFFAGDQVRAVVDGQPVTGVIEDFSYDVPALLRGEPGDTANIRTEGGVLVSLPAGELEVTCFEAEGRPT